jgi:molybdopterin synthase sulfur carrier subunit
MPCACTIKSRRLEAGLILAVTSRIRCGKRVSGGPGPMMENVRMQIEFYGRIAASFGGAAQVEIPEAGLPVSGLKALLASRFNVDAVLHRTVRAAVNNEFVPESHVVVPGDTVEFLSPVSGG